MLIGAWSPELTFYVDLASYRPYHMAYIQQIGFNHFSSPDQRNRRPVPTVYGGYVSRDEGARFTGRGCCRENETGTQMISAC